MNAKGHFGFYALSEWWESAFSDQEKARFKEVYKPMGGSYEDLFVGPGGFNENVVWFLTMLSGFPSLKSDASITLKFLLRAEDSIEVCSMIDRHFLFHQLISTHYKLREDKMHYERAKYYCLKQISISKEVLVEFRNRYGDSSISHLGFQQMAVILEKEKRFAEAIVICQDALLQEWKGDWQNRIERLKKHLNGT
jgi:hypothetical protein